MKKVALLLLISLVFISACSKAPEQPQLGGDADEHGCMLSAGYSWCELKQKCLRPWEEECSQKLIGGDKDEHGCLIAAGYSWCESKQKCIRPWEEDCACVGPTCPEEPREPVCKDKCGDGICQEIVCLAIGCPCAETRTSCPEDCK